MASRSHKSDLWQLSSRHAGIIDKSDKLERFLVIRVGRKGVSGAHEGLARRRSGTSMTNTAYCCALTATLRPSGVCALTVLRKNTLGLPASACPSGAPSPPSRPHHRATRAAPAVRVSRALDRSSVIMVINLARGGAYVVVHILQLQLLVMLGWQYMTNAVSLAGATMHDRIA
jgi:hypothetical protein